MRREEVQVDVHPTLHVGCQMVGKMCCLMSTYMLLLFMSFVTCIFAMDLTSPSFIQELNISHQVKLSLCIIKHNAMKMYGGVEV
jgi:hypothetical protein